MAEGAKPSGGRARRLRNGIAIVDFGSQYTVLIARRLRALGVYCEIFSPADAIASLGALKPAAIVLSGGPQSVEDGHEDDRDIRALLSMAPTLGICYGMQLIVRALGGKIARARGREYGEATLSWPSQSFDGSTVWMSHGDGVSVLPDDLTPVATSDNGVTVALESERILCLQFHPEVHHSAMGQAILAYFLTKAPRIERNWKPLTVLEEAQRTLPRHVEGDGAILCALSGGVDSSVAATLLTKVFGPSRVDCLFVDTGLLRKGEYDSVLSSYKDCGLAITSVDAADRFLSALQGVADPERKRKVIGHTFIDVFKDYARRKPHLTYLAQGTLYPDRIESQTITGKSQTIKSHHNVGGLPEALGFTLVEPLRDLFKDEVRALGKALGLPETLVNRHPFPGPGLAVRIPGCVTRSSLALLRDADAVFIDALHREGLYDSIWQAFVVLLPLSSVGVQGDQRTYDRVAVLRAVQSVDGMTASCFPFSPDMLARISSRITNEVPGINRVLLDVSTKPPATIEWE